MTPDHPANQLLDECARATKAVWPNDWLVRPIGLAEDIAAAVLAIARPAILEEAAKVCEDACARYDTQRKHAHADAALYLRNDIRALAAKENTDAHG